MKEEQKREGEEEKIRIEEGPDKRNG